MKRFVFLLTTIFMCIGAYAETFNQYWYVENNTPIQTTCETGGDITLPTPPTKYGYDFIGWEKLPYIRIEYLESTGTQIIKANVDTESQYLHVKTGWTLSRLSHTNLVGTRGASFYYSPSGYLALWLGYEVSQTLIKPVINTKYDADYIITPNDITFTINNQTLTTRGYTLSDSTMVSIGSTGTVATYGKVYYVQIIDSNGNLLADFIPVLDPAGTPCMYDRVEGKFYYNAGTGQFIAGPVIGE